MLTGTFPVLLPCWLLGAMATSRARVWSSGGCGSGGLQWLVVNPFLGRVKKGC